MLKTELHWMPDPAPSFVTARVVADAGGVYARAVLLSVGPQPPVKKGEIALDDRGLVGRVTEVGARSARVLLITDLNSRVPVILQGSEARAILVGTNNARPRLMFWPEGSPPAEGERVVTSAEAGAFPAGLPVGRRALLREQRARGRALCAARPAHGGAGVRLRHARPAAAGSGAADRAGLGPGGHAAGSGPVAVRAAVGRAHPGHPAAPDPRAAARRGGAERDFRWPRGAAAAAHLGAARPAGAGGAAAGDRARLRVLLVAVPPRLDAARRGVPARPADGPARPGAARDRRASRCCIVHGVALRWRRALVPQGFVLVWLVFIGVAAGAAALDWGLGSLLAFRLLPAAAAAVPVRAHRGALPGARDALHPRASRTIADPGRA